MSPSATSVYGETFSPRDSRLPAMLQRLMHSQRANHRIARSNAGVATLASVKGEIKRRPRESALRRKRNAIPSILSGILFDPLDPSVANRA